MVRRLAVTWPWGAAMVRAPQGDRPQPGDTSGPQMLHGGTGSVVRWREDNPSQP